MTRQKAFMTAACRVAGSCGVHESGSSFSIRWNSSSESVVPLMFSNSSSRSFASSPRRILAKLETSPVCTGAS